MKCNTWSIEIGADVSPDFEEEWARLIQELKARDNAANLKPPLVFLPGKVNEDASIQRIKREERTTSL